MPSIVWRPAREDTSISHDATRDRAAALLLTDRLRSSIADLRARGVVVAMVELGWRQYGVLHRDRVAISRYRYPDAPRMTSLLGLRVVMARVPDCVVLWSRDGECYELAAG